VSKWNLISKRCLSCSVITNRATSRKREPIEKSSGRRKKKSSGTAERITQEDDFFADLRSEAKKNEDSETKRLLSFSKGKYIVNLKSCSRTSTENVSGSLSTAIEDRVWISETLPSTSKLRLHMMGEPFFKGKNLQQRIDQQQHNLKAGFFRKCLVVTAVTAFLPLIAMKIDAQENASAANLLATKLSFLNLNFMLVWYTYRTYLNRVQIVPCVYFDETSGVTSIQLRSNQVLTKPTQHQNAKNVFINIPPILSNPNEFLMTSYSQELMDEKGFILDDQRTEDGNKFGENNPLSTYAKLLARGHLNGVGNKNFPVAVLYDDWINIHPELQTKGVAVLPMIPPHQSSKILEDPLWSSTDFGRAIAKNISE